MHCAAVEWSNLHRIVVALLLPASPCAGANDFDAAVRAAESGDYESALRTFTELAASGDSRGENGLGVLYLRGQGVDRDVDRAAALFRSAADKGLRTAQKNLGELYVEGVGVERDARAALHWFRLAAAQGEQERSSASGDVRAGQGVEQDHALAKEWFHKSAEQGNAEAQANIGHLYRAGYGTDRDYVLAYAWYGVSAANGFEMGPELRDSVAEMLTSSQLESARKIAPRNMDGVRRRRVTVDGAVRGSGICVPPATRTGAACPPAGDHRGRGPAHRRSGAWRTVSVRFCCTSSRWRRKLMPSSTWSPGMRGLTCARTRPRDGADGDAVEHDGLDRDDVAGSPHPRRRPAPQADASRDPGRYGDAGRARIEQEHDIRSVDRSGSEVVPLPILREHHLARAVVMRARIDGAIGILAFGEPLAERDARNREQHDPGAGDHPHAESACGLGGGRRSSHACRIRVANESAIMRCADRIWNRADRHRSRGLVEMGARCRVAYLPGHASSTMIVAW